MAIVPLLQLLTNPKRRKLLEYNQLRPRSSEVDGSLIGDAEIVNCILIISNIDSDHLKS